MLKHTPTPIHTHTNNHTHIQEALTFEMKLAIIGQFSIYDAKI